MKNTLYLFLLLGTTVLFTGCLFNGDEEEPLPRWQTNGKPTYFLDDTIKAYTVFPVGSWWVYEDSATGKRDKIEVKSLTTEVMVSNKASYNKEVSTMILYSSFSGFSISAGASPTGDTISTGERLNVYGETVVDSQSPSGGGIHFFSTNMDSLFTFADNINDYGLIRRDYYTSFGGHSSVYSFLHPFQKTPYSYRKGYFARKIGLIRKEYFDGSVWNLIDYHLAE